MTLRYHKPYLIDRGLPKLRAGVIFPIKLLFAVVLGLAAGAVVTFALAAAPAHGAQLGAPLETPAAAFVRALGEEAVGALSNPAISENERQARLSRVLTRGLDFPTIGRLVLGRHWQRASRAEKSKFAPLFEAYLVATYAARLARYRAGTFVVGRTRDDSNGDAIVSTEIGVPGAPPAQVDWRVRGAAGAYKIIDVVVEGISMVVTQRSEFASVIRRGGGRLESLTTQLREFASPKVTLTARDQ